VCRWAVKRRTECDVCGEVVQGERVVEADVEQGATVCARGRQHSAAERPGEGRDRLERTDVVPPRIFGCHSDELTAFERAGMVDAVEPAREVLSGAEVENARFVGVAHSPSRA